MLKASHASTPTKMLLGRRTTVSSAAVLQSQRRIQTRSFRLGPWPSHVESDAQKDNRRQQRVLKYRYMESVGRKLPWEKTEQGEAPLDAMKAAMAQSIESAQSKFENKFPDMGSVKSWSDDLSAIRPGKNAEDVDGGAIDHLPRSVPDNENAARKNPTSNMRNYLSSKRAPKDVTPEEVIEATTKGDAYEAIDPITNRRISRKEPNIKVDSNDRSPASANKQFEDLRGYKKPKVDDPNAPRTLTPEEQSKLYKDLDQYEPVRWNEPDGLRKPTPEEDSKNYKDLGRYGQVKWNEPDGLQKTTPEEDSKNYKDLSKYSSTNVDDPNAPRKLTPEEQSKFYDDLDQYKPMTWHEPDGLPEQTPEEKSKSYDDLNKYGAVKWNEPDGLQQKTPEELSKNYQDLNDYGPIRWQEPDGLRRLTPEEKSKDYEDLNTYETGFIAKDAVLEAHEAKQMDSTPRGNPLPPKVEVVAPNPAEEYNDLDKYGPVRWNEPDGLQRLTPEELSKKYEDLHLYSQYDNADPANPRIHPEVASKQYGDLNQYSAYPNKGPETERIHPEVASKKYKDLPQYPTRGFIEPANIKHVHPEELTKAYKDLGEYKPQKFDSPDKPYPTHPEEATKAYTDLNQYKAVRFDELDRTALDSPETFQKGLGSQDKLRSVVGIEGRADDIHPVQNACGPNSTASSGDFLETRTAQDIRADVLRRARNNSQKASVEKENAVPIPTSLDTAAHETNADTGPLSRHYSRDFPEEFQQSWSTSNLTPRASQYPNNETKDKQGAVEDGTSPVGSRQPANEQDAEFSSMDESFPIESKWKSQSAIETQGGKSYAPNLTGHRRAEAMADPYSKTPQGLETSYAEECSGTPTWPTLVKHYRRRTSEDTDSGSNLSPRSQDHYTTYKVLAFDPPTQTISIAETTSGAYDGSTALTPADILVRLSSPSRFLPYFQSLQSQGFEIVSGGGDVLVFRRLHANSDTPARSEDRRITDASVNPIDMMRKPVMGNFASPTGFVNYDSFWSETARKPEPPFRPNENERRQGALFGEKTVNGEKDNRRKRRWGRKVIVGAVSVAGAAYATGVLGEYFATGGADGLGPKGF